MNRSGRRISLTFGQAFDGTRKVSIKGVMAVETGKSWTVPPLRITGVTSQIGQVVIQHHPGVRIRIDEAVGVRRAASDQKPAADMPDDFTDTKSVQFLRFDAWQADFILRLTMQPKQREVQSAVAVVLDVNSTGLDLQSAITVKTHFAPLFELDVRLSSEWQVIAVQKDNQPVRWQLLKLEDPGSNQLRIQLNQSLAAETSGQFRLSLRRDVEGWPVEAQPIEVNLPELFLPQSNLTESAFVIRGDSDLDLSAFDLKGLDPQPLKADFERMRFQAQDTRYSGKIRVTRKPSRIAAQTVTFGRIDPQTVHTFLQSMVEVQGGGVRSIKVALPDAAGSAVRFQSPSWKIVEQKSSLGDNGQRIWTLQFEQRLRGQAVITCDLDLPRGEAKEFSLPQLRFIDAERQSGFCGDRKRDPNSGWQSRQRRRTEHRWSMSIPWTCRQCFISRKSGSSRSIDRPHPGPVFLLPNSSSTNCRFPRRSVLLSRSRRFSVGRAKFSMKRRFSWNWSASKVCI